MAYLSMLVTTEIITSAQVSFLPVGNTHKDVDQMFKVFKQALLKADTINPDDLLAVLKSSYSTLDVVTNVIESQANWKDFFDGHPDFKKHPYITEAASFLIQKFDGETVCKVKRSMSDTEWCNSLDLVQLDTSHKFMSSVAGAQSSCTDIMSAFNSVPDEIREPIEEELALDIAKRIKACEARINDSFKVQQLANELCKLQQRQVIPFSWSKNFYGELLGSSSRARAIYDDERASNGEVDFSVLDSIGMRSQEVVYRKGTFLIVNCEVSEGPFWVAEIAEDVTAHSFQIKVNWYQTRAKKQYASGKFTKSRLGVDEIEMSNILCPFECLTESGKVPNEILRLIASRKRLFGGV